MNTHIHTHELLRRRENNLHSCRQSVHRNFLSLPLVVVGGVCEKNGGTSVALASPDINRGFCLQLGLVTCESEPGDVKSFVELNRINAL